MIVGYPLVLPIHHFVLHTVPTQNFAKSISSGSHYPKLANHLMARLTLSIGHDDDIYGHISINERTACFTISLGPVIVI